MNSIPPETRLVPALHTGDVVACWGTDRVSRTISLMTSSVFPPWSLMWAPSHVALIHREGMGPAYWYESTTMAGGVVSGQRSAVSQNQEQRTKNKELPLPVSGVQIHEIPERWHAYRGRCLILRPTVILDDDQKTKMGVELREMLTQAIPYDLRGALLSGTRLLRYLAPASGRQLFCSELVARVLQVGGLMNWGSPAGYSPGRLCRALVHSGAFDLLRPEEMPS
jgi:hypothetical protein